MPSLVPTSSTSSGDLRATLRDVVELGKPGITRMAVIVAAGTFLLAAPVVDAATLWRGLLGLCGIGLIVMGAGALNMLLERDVDQRMARTRDRPLAAGRMSPWLAFVVGAGWCLTSIPLLWVGGPPGAQGLTVGLGVFSLFLYVLVYTPMKQRSPWSLVVGAIPGAMPALMGGTLASGRVDVTGVALFAVVALWQLPHFLAISIFRESEYVAAGHKVFPTSLGIDTTKALIIATTAPLCGLGVALWPLGLGGPVFALVAVTIGVWFTFTAASGFFRKSAGLHSARAADDVWARKVFIGSLVWQTVLFGALAVDRVIAAIAP